MSSWSLLMPFSPFFSQPHPRNHQRHRRPGWGQKAWLPNASYRTGIPKDQASHFHYCHLLCICNQHCDYRAQQARTILLFRDFRLLFHLVYAESLRFRSQSTLYRVEHFCKNPDASRYPKHGFFCKVEKRVIG